jgi:hypothetical protein
MLSGYLANKTENYRVEHDGRVYSITLEYERSSDGVESNRIIMFKRYPNEDVKMLDRILSWVDVKSHAIGESYKFDSIEQAFGWLNNHLLDDIKVGGRVTANLSGRGVNNSLRGVVHINETYNDDYPYKVRVDHESYGFFKREELTSED